MPSYEMKIIHMSIGKIYRYKHLVFEHHDYFGPQFLRHKDHEAKDMRRIGLRSWGVWGQWFNLPSQQREQYRLT